MEGWRDEGEVVGEEKQEKKHAAEKVGWNRREMKVEKKFKEKKERIEGRIQGGKRRKKQCRYTDQRGGRKI